jgi:tetratricopeptide (TPR) repeat protein
MQGRFSREMEFEFVESDEGEGFVGTGQVRAVILAHLNQGRAQEAALLIASSTTDVREALLEQDSRCASLCVRRTLADAFAQAGDLERAERAALAAGDPEHAAQLLEQAGLLLRAGEQWVAAGRLDRATVALAGVPPGDAGYVRSVLLLGRIYESTGRWRTAAMRFRSVVVSCALDADSVEVYQRLAEIYASIGERRAARSLFEAVLRFDPGRDRAARGLESLGADPCARPVRRESGVQSTAYCESREDLETQGCG